MYRLKGKNGLFIQPSDKICQKESYDLLGYGTDNNAKLLKYFYSIPQTANDYKQFVADMLLLENMLKVQMQLEK